MRGQEPLGETDEEESLQNKTFLFGPSEPESGNTHGESSYRDGTDN